LSQPSRIRVMIVDDHEIARSGLSFCLRTIEDIQLVAEASSGPEALRKCEEARPDVILMDMRMPGMGGDEATRAIRKQYPRIQVLALTTYYDTELVRRAMQAGAIGYVLKGVTVAELGEAIRAAHAGRPTLAPEAVQALVNSARAVPDLGADLSERERQVLALLVEGLSNQEIAARLVISMPTVKSHVSSILSKLRASSRTEAVSLALRHHLAGDHPKG
jgi:two-component system, NarL family, response regulator LiaR